MPDIDLAASRMPTPVNMTNSQVWKRISNPGGMLNMVPNLPMRKRRLLAIAWTMPAWEICEDQAWSVAGIMNDLQLWMSVHNSLDSLDDCYDYIDKAGDKLINCKNALAEDKGRLDEHRDRYMEIKDPHGVWEMAHHVRLRNMYREAIDACYQGICACLSEAVPLEGRAANVTRQLARITGYGQTSLDEKAYNVIWSAVMRDDPLSDVLDPEVFEAAANRGSLSDSDKRLMRFSRRGACRQFDHTIGDEFDWLSELRAWDWVLSNYIRDMVGDPFDTVSLNEGWISNDVISLADSMLQRGVFDQMDSLWDLLEANGCDDTAILMHCLEPPESHVRGCWLIDGILGR